MRAILTYHSIDSSQSPISIDRASFARHVAFLASGRVPVVPLVELNGLPAGAQALAITFDDGFENFAEHAWPLLRDARLPATLFVATRRLGTTNSWEGRDEPGIPTLPLLGADLLRSLAREGLELGSHSRTHPHLDRVDETALVDEIEGSATDLADLTGTRPSTFCYPYGDWDERSAELVRAHYRAACTTELRALAARDPAHLLPRLDAYYYRASTLLERFGSPAFRAHLALRRQARRLRAWTRSDGGSLRRSARCRQHEE